jgi:hypothetical protein
MYKHLSEFIVRIMDLAEAEGRVLRRVVGRLGAALAVVLIAAALALAGCVLLMSALWLFVDHHHGPVWACLATGVVTLLLAAALAGTATKFSRE